MSMFVKIIAPLTLAALFGVPLVDNARAADGLTLCLHEVRGNGKGIFSWRTDDEGPQYLSEHHKDFAVERADKHEVYELLGPFMDMNGYAKGDDVNKIKMVGIILYDIDVKERPAGGSYGTVIEKNSTAARSYRCEVLRQQKLCKKFGFMYKPC